jgi:hypothetical protein
VRVVLGCVWVVKSLKSLKCCDMRLSCGVLFDFEMGCDCVG